jgi:hypothetical protein
MSDYGDDYADDYDSDDEEYEDDGEGYDEEEPIDGVGFADPGGRSALHAATASNPRNLSCPTCRAPNRLTRLDRARQCDDCADRAEGWGP